MPPLRDFQKETRRPLHVLDDIVAELAALDLGRAFH